MSKEFHDMCERLKALEAIIGTKQLPIPISHGIHELRIMYGELKREIANRVGDDSRDSFGWRIPMLVIGDIYKFQDAKTPDMYIVVQGRDGNFAIKSFPTLIYYRPAALSWEELVHSGTVEDMLK